MAVSAKTVSKDTGASETPTQQQVREARPLTTVVDELDRKITYRNLRVLEEAKLARSLGAELASNFEYMKYVRIACAVQTIDGDHGPAPTKMSFIEARMEWLGDEGMVAVWKHMMEEAKKKYDLENDDEDATGDNDTVAQAKNL